MHDPNNTTSVSAFTRFNLKMHHAYMHGVLTNTELIVAAVLLTNVNWVKHQIICCVFRCIQINPLLEH